MMSRNRILLSVMLALTVLVMGACAVPVEAPVALDEQVAVAETTAPVTLDTVFTTEPPTLDPSLSSDTESVWAIRQMFMGLTAFDENANVVPSLAQDWTMSEDGLTWTYTLRDDVVWVRYDPATHAFTEVGPVTAHDVVYGVRRTLDPNTASDYAYVLYILAGGEELNMADPAADNFQELVDSLGVEALDDYTVQFTLNTPAGYFPSVTGLWITYPQPQDAIEAGGDDWTEPGNIVTNGPYTLGEWIHGSALEYVKNPLWVNADNVQIDVIAGPIIESASTQMSMYEADEVDMMGAPGWGPPLPDIDRIKADPVLSQELIIAPELCTFVYSFVNEKPPFDEPLVRKAFAAAIDRRSIIDHLLKGEQVAAHSFAPPGVFGNVADDMDVAGWMVMDDYAEQRTQAQEWLAEAGYPEGEGINTTLMYDTSETNAQVAQAVQALWAEAFPKASVSLESQEWTAFLQTMTPEAPLEDKPGIFRDGWCADYPDSNNFLNDVFHSKSGNNFALFESAEYDLLVEQAAVESDPELREQLYAQAEKILVDDVTAIAPVYYYTYMRMYKPWITEYVISPVTGDPIYQWQMDSAAKAAARGD